MTRDFEACIEGVSDDVCLLHVAWAKYSGCSYNINKEADLGISDFELLAGLDAVQLALTRPSLRGHSPSDLALATIAPKI